MSLNLETCKQALTGHKPNKGAVEFKSALAKTKDASKVPLEIVFKLNAYTQTMINTVKSGYSPALAAEKLDAVVNGYVTASNGKGNVKDYRDVVINSLLDCMGLCSTSVFTIKKANAAKSILDVLERSYLWKL